MHQRGPLHGPTDLLVCRVQRRRCLLLNHGEPTHTDPGFASVQFLNHLGDFTARASISPRQDCQSRLEAGPKAPVDIGRSFSLRDRQAPRAAEALEHVLCHRRRRLRDLNDLDAARLPCGGRISREFLAATHAANGPNGDYAVDVDRCEGCSRGALVSGLTTQLASRGRRRGSRWGARRIRRRRLGRVAGREIQACAQVAQFCPKRLELDAQLHATRAIRGSGHELVDRSREHETTPPERLRLRHLPEPTVPATGPVG